jgi:hypothetical protein
MKKKDLTKVIYKELPKEIKNNPKLQTYYDLSDKEKNGRII